MIIRHRRSFLRGITLLLLFGVVFVILLSPIFHGDDGNAQTGLEYADTVFNELSKGSSYFIPQVNSAIKPYMGSAVSFNIPLKEEKYVNLITLMLKKANAEVDYDSDSFIVKGNLGKILSQATEDADLLYHNRGDEVSHRYEGNKPLDVAKAWWRLLNFCINGLQKEQRYKEAKVIDLVVKKAIEPGNNFYSIKPIQASKHIVLITMLLSFYILYAIWYGFAIYDIFEGCGLVVGEVKRKTK